MIAMSILFEGHRSGAYPYTIVETSIPENEISQNWEVVVEFEIEVITVPTEDLGKLCSPKIWDFSPLFYM